MKKYFNFVVIKCECERQQICVADEKGEDCNAYEIANQSKGTCENCGRKYNVAVVHLK